jgi:N-acetylglucosamine-6-phosphate deacetylase
MIVLAGGDLVLPDRIVSNGSLVIDGARIVAVEARERVDAAGATIVDAHDQYVLPGFIDVHVHGVLGHDTLDDRDAIAAIAASLPQYGVTGFCPTSVACSPDALATMLDAVGEARAAPQQGSARVLPAHLESNFINPEYCGAQPLDCIRTASGETGPGEFTGREILDVVASHRPDVGILTIAPEMPGGLDLVRMLVGAGHRVSIGHTGATFDQASDAIDAGVRHATHLFNRMSPLAHRAPGATGAALAREEVTAELICDGVHVHPAVCSVAIATKGIGGIIAITDGTAGAGLTPGSHARLGGRRITVREGAAFLDDGTIAGSTLTMDRAFRMIATQIGRSIVEAAHLCSTTAARELGLTGYGVLTSGAVADLVVLDRGLRVVRTFIAGEEVWRREPRR